MFNYKKFSCILEAVGFEDVMIKINVYRGL